MLAEQAAQNAAKVEEAYGGAVQRTSRSYLLSRPSIQAAHMVTKNNSLKNHRLRLGLG
jgi:hypothetical protein